MAVAHPGPWVFVLLALAAFRIYRLIARDTITEPLRAAASYPDDANVSLDDLRPGGLRPGQDTGHRPSQFPRPAMQKIGGDELVVVSDRVDVNPEWPWNVPLRAYVSTLIRCPWCAGAYVSAAAWLLWSWEPRWTLWLAVPWALSAALALAAKLDR